MNTDKRKTREEINAEIAARKAAEAEVKAETEKAAAVIEQVRFDKEAADAKRTADSIIKPMVQAGTDDSVDNTTVDAEPSRLGKFLVDAVNKFNHEMENGTVGSIKKKKESLLSTIGFVFKQNDLTQSDVDPLMNEFKSNVYFSEMNMMTNLSPAYMPMVAYIHGILDGVNVTIECPFGTPLNAKKIK